MGTAASGVKLVMLQTRSPKNTLPIQIVQRIDQLNSKKTAFASAAVVDMVDQWTAAEQGQEQSRGTNKAGARTRQQRKKQGAGFYSHYIPITSSHPGVQYSVLAPLSCLLVLGGEGHTIETLFQLDNLDPSLNELYA